MLYRIHYHLTYLFLLLLDSAAKVFLLLHLIVKIGDHSRRVILSVQEFISHIAVTFSFLPELFQIVIIKNFQ